MTDSDRHEHLTHRPTDGERPVHSISDDVVRRRTGRGWKEWFELLDARGAVGRPHREIALWIAGEHGTDHWSAQAITVSYERARGLRAVGEHADGFAITASKTVDVPVERLYESFVDDGLRRKWMPGEEMRLRTASKPRTARFDWGDGATRVNVSFTAKGMAKSTVALAHERLGDDEQAQAMKTFWRDRVAVLQEELER